MVDIKSKSEIIIPFKKIGDENWTEKTRIIITELAENWNDKHKEPISIDRITELENKLKSELPKNLKLFYLNFGIAGIGEQLQDLNEIGWIKDIWKDQPEYGPDFTEEDKKNYPS